MVIEILSRTPLWVWALLAGLLGLGLRQLQPRRVRPAQLIALPLALLVLGLWSMAPTFAAQPAVALAWLAALGGSAWLGLRRAPPAAARWLPQQQRLHLPGSAVPLVLIVAIFSLRYASGVAHALHPEWQQILALQMPLALLFGSLSGLFLGRALGLRTLTIDRPSEHVFQTAR